MNTAQRIAKNFFSLLFSGAVTELLGFSAIVYLARVLGPTDFGKINFAMAIIIYFALVTHLGLPLLGTREIARCKEKASDYFSNILLLRVCLAFISFFLLLLFIFLLEKPHEVKMLILLYGFGLFFSVLITDWIFRGIERMEYIGLGRIVSVAVYVALVFLFVSGREELLLIPCFQIAGSLLAALVLFIIFVKNFGKPKFVLDLSKSKKILRQAMPIGFSFFMIQIFYNLDTVMLGFMKGSEDVGIYNVAYKIIMVLIACVGLYPDTIFPIFSVYYKNGSLESLKRFMALSEKLMITLGLPLTIGGIIVARPLIITLYGPKYSEGIIAFQILILAVLIICFNINYSRGLLACNRDILYMAGVTLPAVVNIVSNFLLIPAYGLKGAAVATVLAEITGFLIMYKGFTKFMKVPFANYVAKPAIASLVMALFLRAGILWLDMNLILMIIGAALTYAASLYLIKGMTKEEINIIKSLLPKTFFRQPV